VPVAEVNGQRLFWHEEGSGPPLLCVMGLGADHLAWTLQMPQWTSRFRTVVFDNRDVGRSSRAEEGYGLADLAADTLGLADEIGLERFHLAGMSMGGAIAQHVALAAPERIETLTLINTYAGASIAYSAQRVRVWEREIADRTPREMLEALMLLTYSEATFEREGAVEYLIGLALQNPYPQEADAFIRQAWATAGHDVRERIGGLRMPVHVIGAEHDILLPLWKQRELAELIDGAELTVIAGSGHASNVERGEELAAAVAAFIERRR
jgi:pimeloyl-ACP methyl ester carboxylesterase